MADVYASALTAAVAAAAIVAVAAAAIVVAAVVAAAVAAVAVAVVAAADDVAVAAAEKPYFGSGQIAASGDAFVWTSVVPPQNQLLLHNSY